MMKLGWISLVMALMAAACSSGTATSVESSATTVAPSTTPATTTSAAASITTAPAAPSTDPAPSEQPLWQQTHQDIWWYAASIHADNTPAGTPQWARDVWDEIVQVDPDAPIDIRPFWSMKTGGRTRLNDSFFDEIKERTGAGFRVVFTLKDENASPAELRRVVEEMAARDSLPWGVGLWNELDFGGRNSPQEFSDIMTAADLPGELEALHDEFGVMVSPPGLASFSNIIQEGYGKVIKDLFADRRGVFIKVHSYGHLQPKYWVEFDLKRRVQKAVGMPDAIVIIEETANSFVGEGQSPKPGVGDAQGAEFMRAAMYAGMQSAMPTSHFMLYHRWSNWNDISDPVEGALRREVAVGVLEGVRSTGDNNPPGALELENPVGKELDAANFKP